MSPAASPSENEITLVSVALATFNGERFLREQLDSVYAQTYRPLEVVATDDRSTDGTLAILEEYRARYGLRYSLNPETLGYPKNFEQAASLCRGAYVALCDQDDVWEPDKLATLVGGIGDHSLVYSDALVIDASGQLLAKSFREYARLPRLSGHPFETIVFRGCIRGFQMLLSRDLLQAALPVPPNVTHDDWFSLVATKRHGIRYVDQPLVRHRRHAANVTGPLAPLSTTRELVGALANPWNRQANRHRREFYQRVIQRLDSLALHPLSDDRDKSFIGEVRRFYQCQLDTVIHWRSFVTAVRRRRYAMPDTNALRRLKFILASLIHP